MATASVTERAIKSALQKAKVEGKTVTIKDRTLRGFGFRASPSGHVSFVFQHRVGGRDGKLVHTTLSAIDAASARTEAEKHRVDANAGVNLPQQKALKKKAVVDYLRSDTFDDVVERFLARKPQSQYWADTRERFNRDILPALGKQKIGDIKRADIQTLLDEKLAKGQPSVARLILSAVRPVFKDALARELIAVSPAATLSAQPSERRERVLDNQEIASFWRACSDPSMTIWGPFFKLLLLTGQRREEVASLNQGDLDFETWTWKIPKTQTKNKKEHLVHLSPQAQSIVLGLVLANMPPRASGYLFSTTGDSHISGYSKAKAKLDRLMADLQTDPMSDLFTDTFTDWRIHDLRRTCASGMQEFAHQGVIEWVLNHVSGVRSGIMGRYQRYPYEQERRDALFKWGERVSQIVKEANHHNNE
jgi:integrase